MVTIAPYEGTDNFTSMPYIEDSNPVPSVQQSAPPPTTPVGQLFYHNKNINFSSQNNVGISQKSMTMCQVLLEIFQSSLSYFCMPAVTSQL